MYARASSADPLRHGKDLFADQSLRKDSDSSPCDVSLFPRPPRPRFVGFRCLRPFFMLLLVCRWACLGPCCSCLLLRRLLQCGPKLSRRMILLGDLLLSLAELGVDRAFASGFKKNSSCRTALNRGHRTHTSTEAFSRWSPEINSPWPLTPLSLSKESKLVVPCQVFAYGAVHNDWSH